MNIKDGRLSQIILDLATKFIETESNRVSLITVTKVELANRGKLATILFTVFPDTEEVAVIEFLKRRRSDFRDFVKAKSRIPRIPFFDFMIDLGEKNRQKIDKLSQQV